MNPEKENQYADLQQGELEVKKWFENHRAAWIRREQPAEQPVIHGTKFGEEDAKNEWDWSRSFSPEQIFAPVSSYEDFCSTVAIFLLGRRGTGKTALLHMLKHDIDQEKPAGRQYQSAAFIVPIDFMAGLATLIRGSCFASLHYAELQLLLRSCWTWFLILSTYYELSNKFADVRVLECEVAERIHEAIDLQLESGAEVVLDLFRDIFRSAFEAVPAGPNQLALTAMKVQERLGRGKRKFEQAIARKYKEKQRLILALVESEEKYRLGDELESEIRTALIDTALEFYSNHRKTGLLVKVALPSELYPHLVPANREKIEDKIIFIVWRFRDLVTLTAKRFLRLVRSKQGRPILDGELKSLNNYDQAKEFLSRILPTETITRNGVSIDTMSYIIRHTQKKPRQLIVIFNCLLSMAQQSGKDWTDLTSEKNFVKEAVHARLLTLVNGTIDIYQHFYDKGGEIIRKTLTGQNCYFLAPDLDKAIKQSNDIRVESIQREDVRQLLLQSGILGLVRNPPRPAGKNRVEVMEAEFEYQIKGGLTITNSSLCVVHPMFYEHLAIFIDTTVLVYPKPTELEERSLTDDAGLVKSAT